MKYGIYYAYWETEWKGDFIPYIKKVKRLGFDTLEIACHNIFQEDDGYLRELREEAARENIFLTGGYGPDRKHNISSDDPAIVSAALQKYERIFKKMETAGMQLIGGGLYSYWPVDFSAPFNKKQDTKRAIENIRFLSEIAAGSGITLCMEVLNRFEGYILNTAEEAAAFVDAVNRPNVKAMLDTFHMNLEEDSYGDAIRLVGSKLGHMHVGEANRRPPHDHGRIPWKEIGNALREIGYNGTVVMEPFVRMGGQVGQDIHIWHDLSRGCDSAQLDADASNSVQFLKSILE